eukprot:Hpha_TRINITY_DN11939_c0_g2::TRINITY_DN11939_c0_g2_i2::g.20860::m.20860
MERGFLRVGLCLLPFALFAALSASWLLGAGAELEGRSSHPPAPPPGVTVSATGGLGNRIYALLGAAALAEHLRWPLRVAWGVDGKCRAPLHELFTLGPSVAVSGSLEGVGGFDVAVLTPKWLKTWKAQLPELQADSRRASLGTVEGLMRSAGWEAGAPPLRLLYSVDTAPPGASGRQLRQAAGHVGLRLNSTLRAEAAQFAKLHGIDRSVIGVHLRGTDAWAKLDVDAVARDAIARYPGRRFFVCGDEAANELSFSALLGANRVVVRTKAQYPRRARAGEPWRTALGGTTEYNIERSAAAVADAAIDMQLLSL